MNKLEALDTLKLLKDFVLENNENGLDRSFINGACDSIEKKLTKLIKLEIIENKLDCPLEVIFKALENGFYDHAGKFIECPELSGTSEAGWIIGNALSDYQFFKLGDYGKKTLGGWVLTKEELE